MRNLYLRLVTPALFVFSLPLIACVGCGDDDDPNGPDPPPGNEIIALHGVRFKGQMGQGTFDKVPQFALTDSSGNRIPNQQFQLDPVEGDATIPRSITADGSGVATLPLTFDGDTTYAVVRISVPDVDTLTVEFRADAIFPGPDDNGQVSYIRFSDKVPDVVAWMGEPDSYDAAGIPVEIGRVFMNYESSLGVVVMIWDFERERDFDPEDSVYGVIVNTIYDGTTVGPNPIGIGSTFGEMRSLWGDPDTLFSGQPDTVEYFYAFQDLFGFAFSGGVDTILTELQFRENVVRPAEIQAVNGIYYTGFYGGSTVLNPAPEFTVRDIFGNLVAGQKIQLSQIEGDGSFVGNDGATQMETGPDGVAEFSYRFDGSLGHSIMRLIVPEVDSLDVFLRANVLIPGATGQGQYVLLSEWYADVVLWNGQPESFDTSGAMGGSFYYANYSSSLGLQFLFDRPSGQPTDTSQVLGVVAEPPYTGDTPEGIGVGSTIADVRAAYGDPTNSTAVAADTLRLEYDPILTIFDVAVETDTTVFRVILRDTP